MPTSTLSHDRVTWLNILNPTAADIAGLQQLYPVIHPLNLQDCLTELEFPKLDHYDDYVFLVVQFPYWSAADGFYRPAEVDIFISKGILVTAHHGELTVLQGLFDRLQNEAAQRDEYMGKGASPLLYHLLDELVAACFPIARKIQEDLLHVENNLFKADTQNQLMLLARLRRDIIAVKSTLKPQIEVIRALIEGQWPFIHDDLNPYWSDITDHLSQLNLGLDEYAEVVAGLSETVDTLASHRIDHVVRLLTLVTIITLPVTVVSTIFSMNIVLPLARQPLLFYTLMGLGVGIAAVTIWYLRLKHWL